MVRHASYDTARYQLGVKMFVIVYRGKAATLEQLYEAEERQPPFSMGSAELRSYLAAPTAQEARELFLHYFGFTWKERAPRIECGRMVARR